MRRIITALVFLAPATVLIAQSPAPPAFEVASVRPAPKGSRLTQGSLAELTRGFIINVLPGGRVEIHANALRDMIAMAYGVNTTYQKIEGGTRDLLDAEFIVSARAAAPTLTRAEAHAMVRTLLEERFRLRWRWQPRAVDGYLLMPSREDGQPGPALRPFTGDCDARAEAKESVRFDSPEYEQKSQCGWRGVELRQRAVGLLMADLARDLTNRMVAPVSDRTGWPGRFTFDVIATISDMPLMAMMSRPALGTPPASDAPQLLEVFRRELGLKLVKDASSVNDFVIERVEPLIEN
jgi:uncharacterized protein (TIGR03435 family)